MEGEHCPVVESHDMTPVQREWLILFLVFVAVVGFVWKFIVADLPDDFLGRIQRERKKEGDDGRLRDHR